MSSGGSATGINLRQDPRQSLAPTPHSLGPDAPHSWALMPCCPPYLLASALPNAPRTRRAALPALQASTNDPLSPSIWHDAADDPQSAQSCGRLTLEDASSQSADAMSAWCCLFPRRCPKQGLPEKAGSSETACLLSEVSGEEAADLASIAHESLLPWLWMFFHMVLASKLHYSREHLRRLASAFQV